VKETFPADLKAMDGVTHQPMPGTPRPSFPGDDVFINDA
jgi:hypothetical protein